MTQHAEQLSTPPQILGAALLAPSDAQGLDKRPSGATRRWRLGLWPRRAARRDASTGRRRSERQAAVAFRLPPRPNRGPCLARPPARRGPGGRGGPAKARAPPRSRAVRAQLILIVGPCWLQSEGIVDEDKAACWEGPGENVWVKALLRCKW